MLSKFITPLLEASICRYLACEAVQYPQTRYQCRNDHEMKKTKSKRRWNALAIVSFGLAIFMVLIFLSTFLFRAMEDVYFGAFALPGYFYLAMIPVGMAALTAGIFSIIQLTRHRQRGLWMAMVGSGLGAAGMVLMFFLVRLIVILSNGF